MGLLILLALLIVPPALVSVLRGTRLFWLPGVALFGVAVLAFASMSDAHGEAGVMRAMANGILGIAGMCCGAYGVICLVVAARPRRLPGANPDQSAAVELPPVRQVLGRWLTTRALWLPGIALIGLAIVQFVSLVSGHGEAGVTQTMTDGILGVVGLFCGAVCLVVADRARRRPGATADQAAAVELPSARVVSHPPRT